MLLVEFLQISPPSIFNVSGFSSQKECGGLRIHSTFTPYHTSTDERLVYAVFHGHGGVHQIGASSELNTQICSRCCTRRNLRFHVERDKKKERDRGPVRGPQQRIQE